MERPAMSVKNAQKCWTVTNFILGCGGEEHSVWLLDRRCDAASRGPLAHGSDLLSDRWPEALQRPAARQSEDFAKNADARSARIGSRRGCLSNGPSGRAASCRLR